jgi:hypothetical protein
MMSWICPSYMASGCGLKLESIQRFLMRSGCVSHGYAQGNIERISPIARLRHEAHRSLPKLRSNSGIIPEPALRGESP